MAITLGKNRAASLLDKTLQEEEDTDRHLTDIAESYINFEAEEEDEKSEKSEKNERSMESSMANSYN